MRPDPEILRKNLKKNWRGTLNRAERSHLQIEWDVQGHCLPWLLKTYALDRTKKGYDGPSLTMLKALSHTFGRSGNLLIGRAYLDDQPVGAILILCHGRAATYQVGWTSDQGRAQGAQHLLLWNALGVLKERGIDDFDLGGVNDDTAKGVKNFKQGMGGALVNLAGLYT